MPAGNAWTPFWGGHCAQQALTYLTHPNVGVYCHPWTPVALQDAPRNGFWPWRDHLAHVRPPRALASFLKGCACRSALCAHSERGAHGWLGSEPDGTELCRD